MSSRSYRFAVALVLIAMSASCNGLLGNTKATMREQFGGSLEQDQSDHATIGAVDRATLASGGEVYKESRIRGRIYYKMMLRGVLGDELCFGITSITGAAAETRQQAQASLVQLFQSARYEVRFLDSEKAVTKDTPWPDPPATQAFRIEALGVKHVDGKCRYDDHGDKRCLGNDWHTTVGLCIPVPAISPTASYMTLIVVWKGDDAWRNAIVPWKLTGTLPPTEEAPSATPTDPSEQPPAGEHATSSPSGTATLTALITRDKRFSWFSKILVITGYDKKFAEPGPLTVFGLTDAALEKQLGNSKLSELVKPKNKKDLIEFVERFTAKGLHPPADLRTRTALPMLSSSLVFDVKDNVLYLEKTALRSPELNASNGILYPIE